MNILNSKFIIFCAIICILMCGCSKKKIYSVYNPTTGSMMTEEEYKQWTIDNNVEYIAPDDPRAIYVKSYPSRYPTIINLNRQDYAARYLGPEFYRAMSYQPQPNSPLNSNIRYHPEKQQPQNRDYNKKPTSKKKTYSQKLVKKNQSASQKQTTAYTTVNQQPKVELDTTSPKNQYNIGIMLLNKGDYTNGIDFLKKSALQGYRPAQTMLKKIFIQTIH